MKHNTLPRRVSRYFFRCPLKNLQLILLVFVMKDGVTASARRGKTTTTALTPALSQKRERGTTTSYALITDYRLLITPYHFLY